MKRKQIDPMTDQNDPGTIGRRAGTVTVACVATILCASFCLPVGTVLAQSPTPPDQPQGRSQPAPSGKEDGAAIYKSECAICHGANREGSPPEIPALIGVSLRFTDEELRETIQDGLPRMVAFPNLASGQVAALVRYLKTPPLPAHPVAADPTAATPKP
jgi:mono/diheme cytochrome c family protein